MSTATRNSFQVNVTFPELSRLRVALSDAATVSVFYSGQPQSKTPILFCLDLRQYFADPEKELTIHRGGQFELVFEKELTLDEMLDGINHGERTTRILPVDGFFDQITNALSASSPPSITVSLKAVKQAGLGFANYHFKAEIAVE